jgi:hypothetical protein
MIRAMNNTAISRRQQNVMDAIGALAGDTSFSLRERLVTLRSVHEALDRSIKTMQETAAAQADAAKTDAAKAKDKQKDV